MKTARIWILLLLAVLLPLRGAMAAAMLCPMGGADAHAVVVDGAMAHQHGCAPADDGAAGAGHAGADHCSLCLAFCSLMPVPSSPPTLAEPLAVAVTFAELPAPPPNFFSDGQERPPRTL